MDLTYPAESERYRARVRATLRKLLPRDWRGLGALSDSEAREFGPWWRDVLRENSLLAPDWPTEYGGQGLSLLDRSILADDMKYGGRDRSPSVRT